METESPPATAINLLINFLLALKVVKDTRQVKRFILISEPIKYEIR